MEETIDDSKLISTKDVAINEAPTQGLATEQFENNGGNEPPIEAEKPVEAEKPIESNDKPEYDTEVFEKGFKSVFGDKFESADKLKSSLTEYETKVAEYESKLKELEQSKVEFANEKIKQLNELAKNGLEITEDTVAFLNKDYDKIDNPLIGLKEAMKNEHPDWSDKKIEFELEQKYRLDQIQPDEDGELTEQQKRIKDISDEDVLRDWNNAKKSLKEKQDSLRLVKPQSEAEKAQKAKEENDFREKIIKQHTETTEKFKKEFTKLKVDFPSDVQKLMNGATDKIAPFEYELSKAEQEDASALFKDMGLNLNTFWAKEFADKDGKFTEDSMKRIYEFVSFYKAKDKLLHKIGETMYKNGREFEVKIDKKPSFKPNERQSSTNVGGLVSTKEVGTKK